MADYHLRMKPVSRGAGRSSVAAAAYRAGVRLEDVRTGDVHDFTAKGGVVSAQIFIPTGIKADWALDREVLWNAAEAAEVRKDARVAREFEIAIPHKLSAEARKELVDTFAQLLANRYGVAVDACIHKPDRSSDQRNHHAHVLVSTRKVGPWGFGDKTDLERENKWLIAQGRPTTQAQLRQIREDWADVANVALQRAGLDLQIDHRSYEDRGIDLIPSEHVGVFGTRLGRRGSAVERVRLSNEDIVRNADLVRRAPSQILDIIASEQSVFTRDDVRRALWRCALGKRDVETLLPLVMAAPELCVVQGPLCDGSYDSSVIKYSTAKMVALETRMADGVRDMAGRGTYGVGARDVDRGIGRASAALRREVGDPDVGLSDEQVMAVRHVTQAAQISVVIGYAGSGKSTMLLAAREAWEIAGSRVHGAALAGKAAKGLEDASGISARTLASWQRSWDGGHSILGVGDVLVLDEAGMVGSVQMARLVDTVERAGAKLVLVGDSEQLQAIGAGGAFNAIQSRVGAVGLEDVRRQHSAWQREASVDFASHRTDGALARYAQAGAVHFAAGGEECVRNDLLAAYVERRRSVASSDILVLAHRRKDVAALNEGIREVSQVCGWIAGEDDPSKTCEAQTREGVRRFVQGDRLVFLENDRETGVKNGMLGTVTHASAGTLQVRPDGEARVVDIPLKRYDAFDYGYATTIHKAQGATTQHSLVLASDTMDRHLAYVAMTRHRESVALFADEEVFGGLPGLSECLSRAGLKETTLDYIPKYAVSQPVQRSENEDISRAALMKGDPKRQALLEFAQACVGRLRQQAADLPVLGSQEERWHKAAQKLEQVWPGRTTLVMKALDEQPTDLVETLDLKGAALLKRFEGLAQAQIQREGDPEYRALGYIKNWTTAIAEYQKLERPTEDQTKALRKEVHSLSQSLDKDPVARSLIETGRVKIGDHQRQMPNLNLNVSDLVKGQVPSQSLGLQRGGPSYGMGM